MIILGTNSIKASGFDVDYSCMFGNPPDGASSPDYLTRTPSGATNQKTFTISYWVKRWGLQTGTSWQQVIGQQASNYFRCGFNSNEQGDIIRMYGPSFEFRTTALYRDVSAWYHVVLAIDTTQGTESNRAKLYVNGTQVTSFVTATYPGQNVDQDWNVAAAIVIGRSGSSGNDGLPAYLAQLVNIDGTAYAASDFGEFDSDDSPTIWKPKDVSGLTFGTNGFFLDFADAADLGDDESGNTNDFAETGIAAINQVTDTPTNNFATLNPLDKGLSGCTVSEGNTHVVMTSGAYKDIKSTIGMSAGKWYWETKLVANPSEGALVGITQMSVDGSNHTAVDAGRIIYQTNGNVYRNVLGLSAVTGVGTYTDGDIISTALDMTNGTVKFYKNGSLVHTETNSTFQSDTWSFYVAGNDSTWSANFGNPSFAISSGNADGDGYGNFEYAVPSGYFALCTKNLAEYG